MSLTFWRSKASLIRDAAEKGDSTSIAKLLQHAKSKDIDERDSENGYTALLKASKDGHADVVKLLLAAGANVHRRDKSGETALLHASREGHLEVVRLLIAAGAEINSLDKYGCPERTVLMWAAEKGHAEVVQLLVGAGANLRAVDSQANTALFYASEHGHVEVVKVLLAAGADVQWKDSSGWTALMRASYKGHAEVVKVLLAAGIDKTVAWYGRSALHLAATQHIKDLLNAHSDVLPALVVPDQASSRSGSGPENLAMAPTPVPPALSGSAAPNVVLNDSNKSLSATPSDLNDPEPAAQNPVAIAPSTPAHGTSEPKAVCATAGPIPAPAAAPVSTPFTDSTEQDRGALHAFLQHSTELLQGNARLQQVMCTVAAHDRTLQMLVSKEKECPSLFWFYPKKPELRRWLSDPAKCLFQDTLMMVVVCPVTLCVVECGPAGLGWEVTKPKEWVKKWGPAILFSIYVMQAAVVAGRVVGIPLPPVPGTAEIKEALGLKGMLRSVFSTGANQANLQDSLTVLRDITAAVLEQSSESRALCDATKEAGAPLPADLPMHMVGEAYKSIHTFLTTGENAKLGKLEDQLRGRMERVMAPDGDIEWVSVQGRDAWLQKCVSVMSAESNISLKVSCLPDALALGSPALPSYPPTWLGEKLAAAGIALELVQLCDRVLVREQGFGSEKRLARMPSEEFDRTYLTSLGISAKGLQMELLDLHRELRETSKAVAPPLMTKETSVRFTEEDRQLLQKLKSQQKAPEPTTHTVERGNQMQYTASAFRQQGPQGAQDQQQLARRIAELEAALVEHMADNAVKVEDATALAFRAHEKIDESLLSPAERRMRDAVRKAETARTRSTLGLAAKDSADKETTVDALATAKADAVSIAKADLLRRN